MSDLSNIRAALEALSESASRMAQSLEAFKQPFTQAQNTVLATVGGSARKIDDELVNALGTAGREVDEAVIALRMVSHAARMYGDSL